MTRYDTFIGQARTATAVEDEEVDAAFDRLLEASRRKERRSRIAATAVGATVAVAVIGAVALAAARPSRDAISPAPDVTSPAPPTCVPEKRFQTRIVVTTPPHKTMFSEPCYGALANTPLVFEFVNHATSLRGKPITMQFSIYRGPEEAYAWDEGPMMSLSVFTENAIFIGEEIRSPASIEYHVPPLEPGTYWMQWDDNPTMMNAWLLVEAEGSTPHPMGSAHAEAGRNDRNPLRSVSCSTIASLEEAARSRIVLMPAHTAANEDLVSEVSNCRESLRIVFTSGISVYVQAHQPHGPRMSPVAAWRETANQQPLRELATVRSVGDGVPAFVLDAQAAPHDAPPIDSGVLFFDDGLEVLVVGEPDVPVDTLVAVARSLERWRP